MANRIVLPELSHAPALYTAELAELVLEGLMDGRTLSDVCRAEGMPAVETVRRWMLDDRDGFAARYRRARQIGAAAMAFQAYEIAADALGAWTACRRKGGADAMPDPEHIIRALLRIEARCRLMAMFLPGSGVEHDPATRHREMKPVDGGTGEICSKPSREASLETRRTCQPARRTERTAKKIVFH